MTDNGGIEAMIAERLRQHLENLELWRSGYLDPTEPDPDERALTMERLKAAIHELELLVPFTRGGVAKS